MYVYLLDYGWPDEKWKQVFDRHFLTMSKMASDTNAAVISSPEGVHFANEVLSWHRVGNLDPEKVLPGIMLTKTDPEYFRDFEGRGEASSQRMNDLLIVPLRNFCTTENEFVAAVEGIFRDLEAG